MLKPYLHVSKIQQQTNTDFVLIPAAFFLLNLWPNNLCASCLCEHFVVAAVGCVRVCQQAWVGFPPEHLCARLPTTHLTELADCGGKMN